MNKISLRIICFISLFAFAAAPLAHAGSLSPTEALNRVYNGRHKAPARLPSAPSLSLVMTEDMPGRAEAGCYVFACRDGRGFLVVSADDAMCPLLGYSASACVDVSTVPPAMRYWLKTYAREIEAAASEGRSYIASAVSRRVRHAIEPLVSTRWNQDTPYNNMCPDVDGARAVTGCVATALAQVMRYHRWPQQGHGANSYMLTDGTEVSMNFADSYFEWNEMLDDYALQVATPTQSSAVAELMFACGVAVDMQYTSTESGAQVLDVPAAMVKYFDYDKGIRYLSRDYYGLYAWEELIYDQLVEFGPVQYSGQSNEGGHSFVCDGYSSDGYFHFNWGWGGMSDGYFLLTALDPDEQGIGGSMSGFSYDQSIIANVSRPAGSETVVYENILFDGDFAVGPRQTDAGSAVTVSGSVGNFSIDAVSGTLGMKIMSSMPSATPLYAEGPEIRDMNPGGFLRGYQVLLPEYIPDGEYIVSPVFRGASGEWTDIPVRISDASSVHMNVSGGICTFTDISGTEVEILNLKARTPFYLGCDFHITAKASNRSEEEFYGVISAVLAEPDTDTPVALGDNFSLDLQGGQSEDIEYISAFERFMPGQEPVAGIYKLYFVDTDTGRILGDGIEVELHARPENVVVAVTGLTLADGRTTDVDKTELSFSATVDCTEGYFGGTLTVAIFPYTHDSSEMRSVATFTSEPLFVEAGASVRMTAGGDFAEGEENRTYMAVVFDGQTQISNPLLFTLARDKVDVRGVESRDEVRLYPNPVEGLLYVESGSRVLSLSVYSAVGAVVLHNRGESQIDMSSLPSGIYFIEVNTEGAGKSIRRIIKK